MTLCVMMVLDPKSMMIEGDQWGDEVGEPTGSPRDQGVIQNIRELSPESSEGGGGWPGYKSGACSLLGQAASGWSE